MSPLSALRMIASGLTPCVTCGRTHTWHPGKVWLKGECRLGESMNAGTWADSKDGHGYRKMTPEQLAESVLESALLIGREGAS